MMERKATSVEEPWNSDTIFALGLYRTLGRTLGIWPLTSHEISSYIRVAFVTITQLWMSISLTIQLLIKGNCGAITDIVDVLSLITCGFLTAIKVIIPKMYQYKMRIIVNSAVEDWTEITDKKSRHIMLRYAKIGRKVFIVQMIGAYAAGFPLVFARIPFIKALWMEQTTSNAFMHDVPIGPNCWLSPNLPTLSYVAYYILQSIQLFVVCTGYIGGDTYFFGIAMHVCGQFELLCSRIVRMSRIKDNFSQRRSIVEFSKRHNHLLMLADNFEKTYNIIILTQVGADTILACISGIVLLFTLRSPDFVIVSGLAIRIYLVYVQLFMYSYVGEKLSEQAEKLQMAVYNCPWYNMPSALMKDISFIIMRCNYPFKLTAGKIYIMNIANFKNIIKAMGSYFSILRLIFINE